MANQIRKFCSSYDTITVYRNSDVLPLIILLTKYEEDNGAVFHTQPDKSNSPQTDLMKR